MTKIEAVTIGTLGVIITLVFCVVAVVFSGFLAGLVTDRTGLLFLAGAIVGGIIIDIIFLKKLVRNIYQLSKKVLGTIYILCSIIAVGLGMGVPILNFGLGIIAGIYTARRMYHINAVPEEYEQNIKQTALFSALIMIFVCCLTGFWALIGGMVGSRFETPILSFIFTWQIIVGMVITGGLILAGLQYWLTRIAAKITSKIRK